MSVKLKIVGTGGDVDVSAQIELPTQSMTFTMSTRGARQLGEHLIRLATMIEAGANDAADR